MPSLETTIKNAIKTNLDALVIANTLKEAQVDDFKVSNIFDRDIAQFPAAILMTPSMESDILTNKENTRTFIFEIVIIEKGENVTSATQIEDLRDAISNKFDDDPTLGGAASGGVEPALSPAQTITDRSRSFIVFSMILRAKAIYTRA